MPVYMYTVSQERDLIDDNYEIEYDAGGLPQEIHRSQAWKPDPVPGAEAIAAHIAAVDAQEIQRQGDRETKRGYKIDQ